MSDYFYGWYFRCQGRDGSIAVIPAVHLSAERRTCSIQLITQKGSLYREFPVSRFRINREKGIMKIGENLFSRKGIYLKFSTPESEEISGSLRFGRFAEPKYDIMGPFSYIPGMECFLTDISGRSILFRKDQSCLQRRRSRWRESALQEPSASFSIETENIALPHIWGHRS